MTRFTVGAMVSAAILGACTAESVPYRPVYREGDRLVASDQPMDGRMRTNVAQVLRFYGVEFRLDPSGQLVIPRRVASDLDTMWNYTTKANDDAWLREHPVAGMP